MERLVPQWTTLRSIGGLRVVQLTIFVPVIGYFILFNDELVHRLEFSNQVIPHPDHHVGLSNGTLLKLMLLYFGLCFVGIGSVLFSIFCPALVRRYRDFVEYAASEIDLLTDRHIKEINSRLKREGKGKEVVFEEIEEALSSLLMRFHYPDFQIATVQTSQLLQQQIEDLRRTRKANLSNLLDRQFLADDQRFFTARLTVALSFLVGGVLVLIPAAIMFLQVSHRSVQLLGAMAGPA
jgi:hypothetical protein